jgi:diguanylate cyclase with GGDEF domain/YXYXY domain-containing protein
LTGIKDIWRWHDAPLDIEFTSLNYDRQRSIVFRYRLIGLEPEWNQMSTHGVHYPAMPPGSYRFEVQALDPDQQRQSTIATLNVSIRPPRGEPAPSMLVAREALQQQATHDALTGLWNRSAILDILQHEMDRARGEGAPLAVVLADIDYFKKINGTLGHLAGDQILRDAAHRMVQIFDSMISSVVMVEKSS